MRAGEGADRGRLVARGELAHGAVDDLAPVATLERWGAAVVEARHDVATIGEHVEPEVAATAPRVAHCGARGLAVNVDQERVALGGVEVGWLDHPAIELHSLADVQLQELRLPQVERRYRVARPGIVHEHAP
jgi:hypothetical protein